MPATEKYEIDSSYDPSALARVSRTAPKLEKGVYQMQITEADRRSSREGKPKVTLTLKANHNLVTDEPAQGRLRFVDVFINSDESNFFLAQLLDATGLEAPKSQDPEEVDEFCEQLKECGGVHVLVGMRKNKDDGEFYPTCRAFLTADAAAEKAADF